MSKLRPTLGTYTGTGKPTMTNGTAYLMILNAVRQQPGLIHGQLETPKGEYCAIGSYFEINNRTCLPTDLVDEVAAVNDSAPHLTKRGRRLMVMRWLKWKLGTFGMSEYASAQR